MFHSFKSSDPNLSLQIASQVAEVGSFFHLNISRSPKDGVTNAPGTGNVRQIRVHLGYRTDGRGTKDFKDFDDALIPIDRFGMGSSDVKLEIPADAPISYDGKLLRVLYSIEIATDVQRGIDPKTNIPVIVVPRNGATTYQHAHPLPHLIP